MPYFKSKKPTYSPTQQLGFTIENWALKQLERQGLSIVQQNYRTRFGEIDLIMHNSTDIIFIEVRYRKSLQFGCPIESVTWPKQKRIIRTAEYFLDFHRQWSDHFPRFDVVGVTGIPPKLKMNWISDAFSVQ